MYLNIKRLIFFVILLVVCGSLFTLTAQTKLIFVSKGGLNLSRLVDLPEEMSKYGNSYHVDYLPGYNFAGELAVQNNTLTFSLGLGYKSLNFDFKRSLNIATSWTPRASLSKIRLLYLYIPLNVCWNIDQEKGLFAILGGQFCWLVNNLSYEIWENYPQIKISRDVFKPNTVFLSLGFGIRIYQNVNLIMELGLTPKDVDQGEIIKEGDYYYNYFHFSKKLLDLSIMVNYDISLLNF